MTLFASPEATAVLGTQTWLMSRIYQPSAYGCYLYSDRPLNDTGSQLLTYEDCLLGHPVIKLDQAKKSIVDNDRSEDASLITRYACISIKYLDIKASA